MTGPAGIEQASAVAVAVDRDGPLCGVLLTGIPGSGKSSLLARCLEVCPWQRTRLIGDDAVRLMPSDRGVLLGPPPRIAGLLEMRGVGLCAASAISEPVPLMLVCELSGEGPRLPEPTWTRRLGHRISQMALDPFSVEAPAKLRYKLRLDIENTASRPAASGEQERL